MCMYVYTYISCKIFLEISLKRITEIYANLFNEQKR